ncbi:hypothetical protein D3C86_1369560 [compost metagenome]
MGVGARRQVHADPAGAPHRYHRIGHFQHQPRAVFQRAAVLVAALVGAVLEELVEQVAVGAVDLNAVEAGGLGIRRALAVGLDDAGDLFRCQCARGLEGLHGADQADVALGLHRAGRHRQLAVQVARVGDAADVPQLQDDPPAGGVHGLGDVLPALYLLGGPDAGGVRVADAHRRDRGGFADDQAGAGALHVVLGHQRAGYAAGLGAAAGQRGHDHAVGQLQIAYLDGVEKCRHGRFPGVEEGGSEFVIEPAQEGLDGLLVALEEVPLADPLAGHQAGALQGGQVRRHGGLRQAGAAVDHPGAHADLQRMVLVGEVLLGILQPVEDLAAHGMGEGLDDFVGIE